MKTKTIPFSLQAWLEHKYQLCDSYDPPDMVTDVCIEENKDFPAHTIKGKLRGSVRTWDNNGLWLIGKNKSNVDLRMIVPDDKTDKSDKEKCVEFCAWLYNTSNTTSIETVYDRYQTEVLNKEK